MKRLVSLFLLCSALFLFVVAHGAVTYAEEGISEGDLCKRQLLSFLQSDAILDLGLYSSPEIGVAAMRCKYPEFNELCLENGLKSTLMKTALSYPDKLKASLLVAWYSGMTNDHICETHASQSDYSSSTYVTPNGRRISIQKYIGSATPPSDYSSISNYASAEKIGNSSYYYNCNSYSWYFLGNTSGYGNSSLLCIDDPKAFFESNGLSTCASRVTTCRPGDIAVYIPCTCEFSVPDSIIHSATVVSGSGSDWNNIVVKSKWGIYPLYRHSLTDCPYYDTGDSHPDSNCQGYTIRFYRLSHRMTSYSYKSSLYHTVKCYCCGRNEITQAHDYQENNMGFLVCVGCGHRKTSVVEPYKVNHLEEV